MTRQPCLPSEVFTVIMSSTTFDVRLGSSPGGTPGNFWQGCAARFSKSWPISDQETSFSTSLLDLASEIHTSFRPGVWEIMSSLLRLEGKQKDFLRHKSHTLWGGTYLDDLYTGVPPPDIFAFRQWDNWSCSFDWTTDWWYWFPVVRQKRRQVLKLQPPPD